MKNKLLPFTFFIACFMLLLCNNLKAQKLAKKQNNLSNNNYLQTKTFNSDNKLNKKTGIGIRLGDPNGITLKSFLNSKDALELSGGRTNFYWEDDNYEDSFFNNKNPNNYNYKGFTEDYIISLWIHYLRHHDFDKIGNFNLTGLQWYVGTGPQVRIKKVINNYNHNGTFKRSGFTSTDIGIDAVIGTEYNLENIPLVFFLDLILYFEIQDKPLRMIGQGGLGIRYNL